MNAPEKLTWNQQKELIRFLIDGSGKLQPTSDVEADFTTDLIFLILRFCQDETNFETDINQFTKARAHELSHEPLPESEIRRIRQRGFGHLASQREAGTKICKT
jgi:hypothetical protein